MIKVEKDVPIPPGTSKYPWRTMEIGDMIRIPSSRSESGIRVQATRTGQRLGKKFSVRRLSETEFGVWRTK